MSVDSCLVPVDVQAHQQPHPHPHHVKAVIICYASFRILGGLLIMLKGFQK